MLRENNIKGGSYLNTLEIIKLLIENNLKSEKPPKPKPLVVIPKYLHLNTTILKGLYWKL